MVIYNFFTENRMIIEVIYSIIILLSCLTVFIKVNKLYKLSLYKGMKYFRNAFLFFGIAFMLRLGSLILKSIAEESLRPGINIIITTISIQVFFEYALTMSGFYLIYSLVWKNFEGTKIPKELILHFIALTIAVIDVMFGFQYFMFISLIGLLSYAAIISYSNYIKAKKENKFPQIYFIVIVLSLIGFLINFLERIISPLFPIFTIYVYLLTTGIFLLFLYGVIHSTDKKW